MIKVALIDDHAVVRAGFAQLLSLEQDIEVVDQFGSTREARTGLSNSCADVCILDISMPDESGIALLPTMPKKFACIMLSVNDSVTIIEKALDAGARGFLSKRCHPDELIQAVRTVVNGGCYLAPDIALKLTSTYKTPRNKNQLTRREREVSELLSQGLNVKAVANELSLSPKTVHYHRANAMHKLGVKNDVELAKCLNSEVM